MRAKEFIIEFSDMDPNIGVYLRSKGYKHLGQGVDQTAYLEPSTGQVLKIFGTGKEDTTIKGGFSEDQRMFIFWAKYCEKNASNPFLPKFSGWETFEFDGKKYLQIRMERLQKLPANFQDMLESMSDSAANKSPNDMYAYLDHIDNLIVKTRDLGVRWADTDYANTANDAEAAINELIMLLGEDNLKLLIDTVYDLQRMSDEQGWNFDLHGGNFMHRDDGYPVIVDPWVV